MGLSESRLAWPLVMQLRRETALEREQLQHLAAAFDRASPKSDCLTKESLAASLRDLGLAGTDDKVTAHALCITRPFALTCGGGAACGDGV